MLFISSLFFSFRSFHFARFETKAQVQERCLWLDVVITPLFPSFADSFFPLFIYEVPAPILFGDVFRQRDVCLSRDNNGSNCRSRPHLSGYGCWRGLAHRNNPSVAGRQFPKTIPTTIHFSLQSQTNKIDVMIMTGLSERAEWVYYCKLSYGLDAKPSFLLFVPVEAIVILFTCPHA